MTDLTATLSAVGTLKATLGAGKINVNDYTLTVEAVENGTNISITRGSQTDTVFVPDYAEDEATRKTAEEGREAAETERVTAEDARAVAEAARENAETARADAETKRTDAETARATAEAGRDAAEAARVEAEGKRVTAESARDTAEAARKTAEEKRVDAETARATAEATRATAENARTKAESQRQSDTAAAISKADTAAESAQSVADTVQAKLDAGELDGYSPSASVTQTDTGATISITDKSGTSTANVQNGTDASVTKDNIASALGYEPEAKRRFELIEAITLSEDTKTVERTATPDGTLYSFTDVYVELDTEPTDKTVKSTQTVYFYNGGNQRGGMYNDGFITYKYCKIFYVSNYGMGYTVAAKAQSLGSFNGTFSNSALRLMGLNAYLLPINRISVNVSTEGVSMAAGGTINIYAIRT